MSAPTFLSLCSGIGGLDRGLEWAGWSVVGQVEKDPWCRRVLAKHWPEVPQHDAIETTVQWWKGQPTPTLVVGGVPCQPSSVAGKGLAQADPRWLWPYYADILRHLRPEWMLLENVPGLLGRGFGDILGDLAALGYDARWDCVPAAAVGAPHLRDRVFLLAHANRPARRSAARNAIGAVGSRTVRLGASQPGGRDSALADTDQQHGYNGRPGDVSDAQGVGRGEGRAGRPTGPGSDGTAEQAPGLADAHGPRRGPWEGIGRAWPAPQRSGWWSVEPRVDRVAPRTTHGVDRLRGLGNAVVPQVAAHIGRILMQYHTEME